MNNILYITKHNPWGIGGGSVASNMYLEAFLYLFKGFHIDLCIADSVEVTQLPDKIKNSTSISIHRTPSRSIYSKLLSPITHITHRYQNIARHLMTKNEYDFIIFDHSSIAGSLLNYVRPNTKTIVIHHNFEPTYFKDNTPSYFKRKLLLHTVKKCEQDAFLKSSVNIFLTKEDLEQFSLTYGKNNKVNIVSGIFEVNINGRTRVVDSLIKDYPTIVITGSLNNIQNIDGIRYFITALYPEIPQSYNIIIAGRNPDKAIYDLIKNKQNIKLIPNPTNMDDIIAQGNIFVSPARLGSGIKVRVTDGLKSGLPILAHTVSARGYEPYILSGYFRVFSNPKEFSNQLKDLVDQINKQTITSDKIISMYHKHNTFESGISKLSSILNLRDN